MIEGFASTGRCFCQEQGIVSTSCGEKGININNEHYETLGAELGVEKEVLKAVALTETGSKGAFQRDNPKHATIVYERHYFRKLIAVAQVTETKTQVTIVATATVLDESKTKTNIVNKPLSTKSKNRAINRTKREAAQYFSNKYPTLIGSQGNYGTFSSQLTKLENAKKLNVSFAIQSCSWGRFQVMGKYYDMIYKTASELEQGQNQCELQHLALFKGYLEKFNMIQPMKDKDWNLIAYRYNGSGYKTNNYHTKMENKYNELKRSW